MAATLQVQSDQIETLPKLCNVGNQKVSRSIDDQDVDLLWDGFPRNKQVVFENTDACVVVGVMEQNGVGAMFGVGALASGGVVTDPGMVELKCSCREQVTYLRVNWGVERTDTDLGFHDGG